MQSKVATDERLSLRSTIDLFAVAWRRKHLLALGMLLGIGLGVLYYMRAERMYQSSAEVLVIQKQPEIVTGDRWYESHFGDYVATHQALIVSPLIVERALESAQLNSLRTFAELDPDDVVDTLISRLEVGSGPRNLGENADSIMNLAFWGPVPEECPTIVQAILDSYKTFLDETYRDMSQDTEQLIAQARDLLHNDLRQLEEDYAQFRQQSPLVARGAEEVNPLQDRLQELEQQRSQWLIRRFDLERQLKAIQQAMAKDRDPQRLLALVADLRLSRPTENSLPNVSTVLDNQLLGLLDRQHKLTEHFGGNHPHVVALRQQIDETRRLYTMPTAVHMQDAEPSGVESRESDPAAAYAQYLTSELERVRISEDLLEDLYDSEHGKAKELSSYQLQDERFRRNIDRAQQLYDGIVGQLQEASLVGDYGGFEAEVIGPPRIGEKVSPSRLITLLGSLLVGGFCGAALALAAEFSDQSFRSREEIQRQFGLPVLGQIPHMQASRVPHEHGLASLDPKLCTYFHPQSLATDAFRSLRASLFMGNRGERRQVLQLTGPGPGEGTSTLAANLAVSMARAGKHVLLIDADLRGPRQHEIFGIESATGLAALITSDEELGDAIHPTAVERLWLLPAGKPPRDASDLLMSPRLARLVDMVREKYDYVLLDSGPLLILSDPCVLAPQVDGLLLNLRMNGDSRRRGRRDRAARTARCTLAGHRGERRDKFHGISRRFAAISGWVLSRRRRARRESGQYVVLTMGESKRRRAGQSRDSGARYPDRRPHARQAVRVTSVASRTRKKKRTSSSRSDLYAHQPAEKVGPLPEDSRPNALFPRSSLTKRVLDLMLAAVASLLLFPLFMVVALMIKCGSRGPIFYRQERIGRDGQPFWIWKFRTMRVDAEDLLEDYLRRHPELRDEWNHYRKLRNDPRTLPYIGRFLRKSSLDEIPQLWNVFKGEMSFVGPRPLPRYHLVDFDEEFLRLRQTMTPGISGLWQVSSRKSGEPEVIMKYDRLYVRDWSLWLDLKILLRTPGVVLLGNGAC